MNADVVIVGAGPAGIFTAVEMIKKGSRQIEGYFDYVVPPLEGFWWQEGVTGVDYTHKETFECHRWVC